MTSACISGDEKRKEKLVRKGWRLGEDLSYFEDEGAEHNERAWAASDQMSDML